MLIPSLFFLFGGGSCVYQSEKWTTTHHLTPWKPMPKEEVLLMYCPNENKKWHHKKWVRVDWCSPEVEIHASPDILSPVLLVLPLFAVYYAFRRYLMLTVWGCLQTKKTYEQKCRDKEEADQNVNRYTNTNNTKHIEKVQWNKWSFLLIED